jgi:hypothetical protein
MSTVRIDGFGMYVVGLDLIQDPPQSYFPVHEAHESILLQYFRTVRTHPLISPITPTTFHPLALPPHQIHR